MGGSAAGPSRRGLSYQAHAVVNAVINGALNAGISAWIATLLWHGFRFDWYVHAPENSFERGVVALDLALGLFVLGLVVTAIVTGLTYRAWDRGHVRVTGIPSASPGQTPRTRQVHVLLACLGLAGVLAGLGALNGLLAFFLLDATHVDGRTFFMMKTTAGALGGALAGYAATVLAARGLASGRIVPTPPDENLLAKAALASARKSGVTVLVVLLITAVMAVGVGEIHTNVDVADVLPRGNPNTAAAQNLTTHFKSAFTQQVTFHFRIDEKGDAWAKDNARLPYRRTTADRENITDEVYLRAIDQAVEFVKNYRFPDPDTLDEDGKETSRGLITLKRDEVWDPRSPFQSTVNAVEFYKLINWTLEGGRNAPRETYALPGTDPLGEERFELVHRAVWAAIPATADALISPPFDQTSILLLPAPQDPFTSKEIGERALIVRDAYVKWAEENPDVAYQVFTGENKPFFTVDLPVANAHASELAEQDFKLLLPLIAYFILIALFVAFRSAASIFVAFSSLVIGVVWTFGAMGYMNIALNTLNLTTIPLIMGVGIDYGIHMINEWQHHRSEGRSNADAFRLAGGRSALAMLVATLTTIGGLLIMVVSPSLLIAQLGLLSAIAIASSFALTLTFIPAAITLLRAGSGPTRKYRPSRLMQGLARAMTRARVLALVIVLAASAAAYGAAQSIGREEFGDPPRNWLDDDPLRMEHERALRGFYDLESPDVKANVLVFEGNVTTPASHKYMDGIEASLRARGVGTRLENGQEGRIIDDTLRTLPFLVRTYLTVRDGAPGAGGYLAAQRLAEGLSGLEGSPEMDTYPKTRAELEALIEEVAGKPLVSFQNLFIDYPRNKMAIMVFSVKAATYEDAEEVWHQVWDAVEENAPLKPNDVTVAFVGNTATNYLFVAEEVPWLAYMTVAAAMLVFVLVLAITRRLRPALAVLALNLVTGVWWIGILPSLDIGLAITLTLPIVFIFCIGSDYAVHLAMSMQRSDDRSGVYATVGKGVLFSFLTTVGAFAIFTRIGNLAVRETMIATTLAICVIFVATILIIPMFYPTRRLRARRNDPGKGSETRALAQGAQGPGADAAARLGQSRD